MAWASSISYTRRCRNSWLLRCNHAEASWQIIMPSINTFSLLLLLSLKWLISLPVVTSGCVFIHSVSSVSSILPVLPFLLDDQLMRICRIICEFCERTWLLFWFIEFTGSVNCLLDSTYLTYYTSYYNPYYYCY